jgi:hypothetical protein
LVDSKLIEMDLSADSAWSRQLAAIRTAEMLVEFVDARRGYAERACGQRSDDAQVLELQHNLDSTDKLLLDAPRNAGDTDRPCLQFAGRTAVRFCGTVSGADDAVLLAKAAGIAMQTVAVECERKHVRA